MRRFGEGAYLTIWEYETTRSWKKAEQRARAKIADRLRNKLSQRRKRAARAAAG